MALQAATLVGKYSPLESFMNDMDGFYVKSQYKHFLIGGDDKGILHFLEFGENWHVCNEVILLRLGKAITLYYRIFHVMRQNIKNFIGII